MAKNCDTWMCCPSSALQISNQCPQVTTPISHNIKTTAWKANICSLKLWPFMWEVAICSQQLCQNTNRCKAERKRLRMRQRAILLMLRGIKDTASEITDWLFMQRSAEGLGLVTVPLSIINRDSWHSLLWQNEPLRTRVQLHRKVILC